MRPRLDCRGEQDVLFTTPERGGAFNAATARLPWRTFGQVVHQDRLVPPSMRPRLDCRGEHLFRVNDNRPELDLQCGHGSIAVENLDFFDSFGVLVEPSMRPRLDCRGELETKRDFSHGTLPSMRPRLDCRGERGNPHATVLSNLCLQCGHGSIAVENDAALSVLAGSSNPFNAATARLPWRTAIPRPMAYNRANPSMRPRLDCRGEPRASGRH